MSRSCGKFCMSEIDFGEFGVEDDFICFRCCETDAWKIASNPIVCNIKNYFNECLTAEYKGPNDVIAVFMETESAQDQKTFVLEKYRTTDPSQWLSIVFTVSVNEETYHLYCTLEKKIDFKPGQCPHSIAGDKSDVIFFAKMFSMGHDFYKFESSLHKDHFLAIKEENGKRVLYLKLCPTDVVDESAAFNLNLQSRTI